MPTSGSRTSTSSNTELLRLAVYFFTFNLGNHTGCPRILALYTHIDYNSCEPSCLMVGWSVGRLVDLSHLLMMITQPHQLRVLQGSIILLFSKLKIQ